MRTFWSFETVSPNRYRLVLSDEEARARWAPGYESTNPRDVIEAMMYLNTGYRGKLLQDRHIDLLEKIKCSAMTQGFEIKTK